MTISVKHLYTIFILLIFSITTFAQKDTPKLKKLSQKADVIVIGKVAGKQSKWNKSKTRIYTKVKLLVHEYIKGSSNEKSVEISYLGGEVEGIGELYTHMPKFEDNEEALVFLKKNKKDKNYQVLNGREGKIKIINDRDGREKVTGSNAQIKALKSQIKSFIRTN